MDGRLKRISVAIILCGSITHGVGFVLAACGTANATHGDTPAVYRGNSGNYLKLLARLKAGDTLVLDSGIYDDPDGVPGLPIFDLNGDPTRPITITGPETGTRPVFLGRSTHNTIRFRNSSYVVVRNIEVDGRNLGGDAVNAQGVSHHITLEGLIIRGVGDSQQTVGISTNGAPTWNWIIRRNEIIGAGTGMYLGNSDGTNPFVAGLIEHNVIRDTIGYNIEIKHQKPRPAIAGMPANKSVTIIRHNVFSKSGNSAAGSLARPNLLVGHFPLSGTGRDDRYEIYGNFFYENPSEALFQGEGNIAFHHNLLVNNFGSAVQIQPHNDVPKYVRVFSNTIVARDVGIRVARGSPAHTQVVVGNAVFSSSPIEAPDQRNNITGDFAAASDYLNKPQGAPGQLDLYPRVGKLGMGTPLDASAFAGVLDWNRDFNGHAQALTWRGAYAGEGTNPGWMPSLKPKPVIPATP